MPTIKYVTEVVKRNEYTESWENAELHCPKCGGKNVWTSTGPDMYFDHLCTGCEYAFCLSGVVIHETYKAAMQGRLAAIRALDTGSGNVEVE